MPCRASQGIPVAGSESFGASKSPEELRVSLVAGGLVSEVGLLQLDGLLDRHVGQINEADDRYAKHIIPGRVQTIRSQKEIHAPSGIIHSGSAFWRR